MEGRTLDADLVRFLTAEIRREVALLADPRFVASKGRVAGREWVRETDGGTQPVWQVIVRDDGTTDTELVTGEASVGVRVYAGSKVDPTPAGDLARIVKAIIKTTPRAELGNPVAAVRSFRGPYPVDESSTYACQYMTCDLAVVSIPL